MRLEITAIIEGSAVLAFVLKDHDRAVIGRSSAADVPLAQDPSLSRMHFELASTADGFIVRDLGSSNGTYVQGTRIRDHRIVDRDAILAGRTTFLARLLTGNAKSTASAIPLLSASNSQSQVTTAVF